MIDLEAQFVTHLTSEDSLKLFLDEGVTDILLLSPQGKSIYAFALAYYEEGGEAPSRAVLQKEFPKFGFPEETEATAPWLVAKLRERYKQQRVQEIIRESAKMTKEPEEAYAFLRDNVFELDVSLASKRYVYTQDDYEKKLNEFREALALGKHQGATTGFAQVDNFMGGLRPGTLSFMLARPKRFKTFMLLNTFIWQARAGQRPVFFTLELTEDEIFRRLACMVSGFPFYKFERGEVRRDEYEMIERAFAQFKDCGEHFIVRPDEDERSVGRLLMEADRLGAKSIIIDQLSFMTSRRSYAENHLKVTEIVKDLKNAAAKRGKERPFLVAAQLNRTAASQDSMADISQAALSDSIGQTADTCFCLHRTKDMIDMGTLEFGVIAGRNHDTRSWMVEVDLYRATDFKVIEEVDE